MGRDGKFYGELIGRSERRVAMPVEIPVEIPVLIPVEMCSGTKAMEG